MSQACWCSTSNIQSSLLANLHLPLLWCQNPRLPKDPSDRTSYRGEEGAPCPSCEGHETVGRKSRATGEDYFGYSRPKRG